MLISSRTNSFRQREACGGGGGFTEKGGREAESCNSLNTKIGENGKKGNSTNAKEKKNPGLGNKRPRRWLGGN